MKKLAILVCASAAFTLAIALPAVADGNVGATVTPFVLAVSATPGSTAYGNLPLSVANDDRSTKPSPDVITATNNSNIAVNFRIRGSNATASGGGDANWTINCSPGTTGTVGADTFVHRFATGSSPDFAATGQALCSGAGNEKDLALGVAPGGSSQFKLQMNMPTSTTGFSERSTTVTVIVVAP